MLKQNSMRILLIVLSCIAINLNAQQNEFIYYKADGQIVKEKDDASVYVEIEKAKKGFVQHHFFKSEKGWQKGQVEKLKFKNDSAVKLKRYRNNLHFETITRNYTKKSNELFLINDYNKGTLVASGKTKSFYPIVKTGDFTEYYDNGKLKSVSTYIDNKLISNKRWNKNGDADISNVYSYADIMPSYKGSIENFQNYVTTNLKYPEDARKRVIQGTVLVEFVVMENGSLSGVNVLRGVDKAFDVEAIRVVSNTPELWSPGLIDNKPVRVSLVLPVVFKF